ncbi:MAG: hypothetical protein HQK79_23115 [Desulfobacterales bacterium]|nr:hypothetical protein [Desulfobacterales bacterium]
MDNKTSEYFTDVIMLARSIFENFEYFTDVTPERAILQIRGEYAFYQIFITELFSDKIRKYRYYILKEENIVEAGFDNAPDPRAIRLKYGKIGKEYAGKHIPHLHLNDKKDIELTEEVTFYDFVQWLKKNITKP